MDITIRNEQQADHRRVEEITRKAFWNLHVPGCNEHLLVHTLRKHHDFVADLDFVAVKGHEIIANIMFSKSSLKNGQGETLSTLTFGPVSVLPEYQRQGVGSLLISHAITRATEMGYPAIIIWGNPHHYCKFRFRAAKACNISLPNSTHPCCLLAKELKSGILSRQQWYFYESDVFHIDQAKLEEFEKTFEPLTKEYAYTQEVFAILSRAFLV